MANQRISQFTYTSRLTGDELIGVAINGQNKAISVGQILYEAENSCSIKDNKEAIDNLRHDVIANELLVRETSEKLTALSDKVQDVYTITGQINDVVDAKIQEVCTDLSSYTKHIQKNSDLIAYVHSDIIRMDKAVGIIGERVQQNIEGLNQHTEDIINLHDGLQALSNAVAENKEKYDETVSYLKTSVYPIVDTTYTYTVENVGKLEEASKTNATDIADLSTYVNEKVEYFDAAYSYSKQYTTDVLTELQNTYSYSKQYATDVLTELQNTYSYSKQYTTDVLTELQNTYSYSKQYTTDVYTELNTKINNSVSELEEKIFGVADDAKKFTEEQVNQSNAYVSAEVDKTNSYISSEVDKVTGALNSSVSSISSILISYNDHLTELDTKTADNASAISNINNKLDNSYAYALQYTTNAHNELDDKINDSYSYALQYTTTAYILTSTYAKDNISAINDDIVLLQQYDANNTEKLATVEKNASNALSLAKDHTNRINQLESHYVSTDKRLDDLEDDSIKVHETLNEQRDAIHIIDEKVNTLENVTIPNLKTELETADTLINSRIDKLVALLGAKDLEEASGISIDSITESIKNTIIARLLDTEDSISHIAWHESHPETSVWGEFGIVSSCGYSHKPCQN